MRVGRPRTFRRALRDVVRVPISRSGLGQLAEGLNRLNDYPRRLWRYRVTLSGASALASGKRPSATPPAWWEHRRWEELESFFGTLFPGLWVHERRFVLPLAEPGTADRAAGYVQEILRTFFGVGLAQRLKQCELCRRWFADMTRNRSKLRCGVGTCTASRAWPRARRRAAGHTQYRRQAKLRKQ